MDPLDLTKGLCGWNSNENENDTISHEMELKNMFNQLKIVTQPKRPNTCIPKSSRMNTRSRSCQQNISKTARTLPKPNRNRPTTTTTLRNRPSESRKSAHSKTSNKALTKVYLPKSRNRKKLQRSHSNLYIRETNKSKEKNDICNANKKTKANNLALELNLDAIKNIAEPITFSEALFRSKYEETLNDNNTNKNADTKSSKKCKTDYKQRSELSFNSHNYKQQLKETPFLTPSTSMISLRENRCRKIVSKTKRNQSINNRNSSQIKRPKTTRTRSRSRKLYTKTNAIPIKCFNTNVLTTHEPKISTQRHQSRVGVNMHCQLMAAQKDPNNIRSKSVDLSDKKEGDGFSIADIEQYHRKMIKGKDNIHIVRESKCEDETNMSLEQKLRDVIARWESHEKIKTRKSCRSRRIHVFK